MRRVLVPITVVAALAVFALPASAQAGKVDRAAKQECKSERAGEPNEFAAQYGGTGKAALERCVRREKRDARRECRDDRATEPNEFRAEYGGTGKAAMRRCKVDEIR